MELSTFSGVEVIFSSVEKPREKREERKKVTRSLGDAKKAGEKWTGGQDCLAVYANPAGMRMLQPHMVKNGGTVEDYFE